MTHLRSHCHTKLGVFGTGCRPLVHEAYGELFKLHGDEAWQLTKPSLSTFFRQSDGTSAIVGDRQVATFVALAELAGQRQPGITKTSSATTDSKKAKVKPIVKPKPEAPKAAAAKPSTSTAGPLKSASAIDLGISVKVEVILPADASKETYDNIFRSIRQHLIDR